jgi:hypothetical protein
MVINFRVRRISRDTQDDPDTHIKKKKTKNILINAKMNYSAKFCMTGKTKIN